MEPNLQQWRMLGGPQVMLRTNPLKHEERVKIMQMTAYFLTYLNISFYHHLHNHADTFSKSLMSCSLFLVALFLLKAGR